MAVGATKRPGSDTRDLSPPPTKRKIAATATNKAVANFFRPLAEKSPEETSFRVVQDTLLVGRHQHAHSTAYPRPLKVAAFDFDDTLITTKSGLKFARSDDDWRWWHATVPTRLKQLHADGYAIAVLSNQGGIALRTDSTKSVSNFKGKVSAVFRSLDFPMSVYAATERDIFRKPRAGMWDQLLKDYGISATGANGVDLEQSFFVGDAGGRAEDKIAGNKKDHACSDRDLAANIGIKYYSPEEYFLQQERKPFTRAFDPTSYIDSSLTSTTDASPIAFTKKNKLDIVLFCGSPGAGKSTFYWNRLKPLGYERVNQDILKTRDKCLKVAAQHLESGESVVVDNTNADVEVRAAWITLARKMSLPIRLVHFTASAKLCEHNDTFRALGGSLMNPESRSMLPKMAFTGFISRYREPKVEEGFQDITSVDFKLEGSDEQKMQWTKFWIS